MRIFLKIARDFDEKKKWICDELLNWFFETHDLISFIFGYLWFRRRPI